MFRRGPSTRKWGQLRSIVEMDRCDVRPGYRHDWEFSHVDEAWSLYRGGPMSNVYKCTKCGDYK